MHTTIIAEAGVNHDGDVEKALKLVDAAADAGADVVKFQTFTASAVASTVAPKAAYQKRTTTADENQFDMLRRLELPRSAYSALMDRARQRNIEFLSTGFDFDSLDFLISLGLPRIKVGSGDMNNAPLLLRLARSGRGIILSTGMATMAEVEESLGVIAHGYANSPEPPSRAAFGRAWSDMNTRNLVQQRVALLQCTTEYPCPARDANLRAMDVMRDAFGLPIGYSDHTDGIVVAIAAVARGAGIIEKHLTLDRTAPGPDHAASLDPPTFRTMVESIRTIEPAIGTGLKVPQPSEIANIPIARKSLVAARQIKAGEHFNVDNITVKRPGGGISPYSYWETLGQVTTRAYQQDEAIEP